MGWFAQTAAVGNMMPFDGYIRLLYTDCLKTARGNMLYMSFFLKIIEISKNNLEINKPFLYKI